MHTRGRQLAAGIVGLLGALALAGSAVAQAPAERPRAPMPQGPRVVSPEVAADRRVTFRILAPKAEAVRAERHATSPSNAQGTPLTKGAEGVWEVTRRPARPRGVPLQLQRGRRVGDRPAQPRDQRVEREHLEPRPRAGRGLHGHEGRAPRRGGRGHLLLEGPEAVPPDARLHAAGLREGRREVPRLLPAARRLRLRRLVDHRSAGPTSSWTT